MNLFSLANFPVDGKTILVRVDFNVPIKAKKITDNAKIKATIPTIKYLLQKNCKVVLATHLGRPNGFSAEFSTKILLKELQKLLPKRKIVTLPDCIGKEIKETIQKGKAQTIFLLENLRFYKEEEQNDIFFAHSLANLAEVYVNDAFGVSHRKHASVDAVAAFLPAIPGLLLEKELQELSKGLFPEKPAVLILGGAKLNKVALVEQALRKFDYLLIGGALAFSFLKAKGISVGLSKIDPDSIVAAAKILRKPEAYKIILPLDFVAAESFSPKAKTEIVKYNQIKPNQVGLDLGPETISLFKKYLQSAKTIIWNGPLGYFEWSKFAASTKEIGRFLGQLPEAITLAGGGETAEALTKFHLHHTLTHVSTGGGAAVEYLSGEKLPAIAALERSYKKFKGMYSTK
ncbi:phosphoglycerate kinase [Candidatus Woesearchaeota archaeon]|nr:phosphoglycerate kinase [Candidatus Woesearchaeota archaeon]